MDHSHYVKTAALVSAMMCASPALADEAKEPRRTRIGLGVQLAPSYPGSDSVGIRPLVDVARTRGDRQFEFEAPDESFGFPVLRAGKLSFGPAIALEGSRTRSDVGADVPKVGFTIEAGAFAQYDVADSFRLRGEMRKGLGGHRGLIANVGADYVARDKDKWLFSIGPRITLANRRYHVAYFGVRPADAVAAGLPAFQPGGGLQSVGATAGFIRQLTSRWGIYSYAKYDRLIGDAARSPLVRQFGSKDQLSGGLALTFTFGRGM